MDGSHNEIMRAIGRIEGTLTALDTKVTEGFTRINGRLGKHDETINQLTSYNDQRKGEQRITGVIWGGITSVVVSVTTWFITKQ